LGGKKNSKKGEKKKERHPHYSSLFFGVASVGERRGLEEKEKRESFSLLPPPAGEKKGKEGKKKGSIISPVSFSSICPQARKGKKKRDPKKRKNGPGDHVYLLGGKGNLKKKGGGAESGVATSCRAARVKGESKKERFTPHCYRSRC